MCQSSGIIRACVVISVHHHAEARRQDKQALSSVCYIINTAGKARMLNTVRYDLLFYFKVYSIIIQLQSFLIAVLFHSAAQSFIDREVKGSVQRITNILNKNANVCSPLTLTAHCQHTCH